MNPEDLLNLLRQANTAVREGADPEAVSRRIADMTGGQISSLSALGEAVRSNPIHESGDAAAQRRLTERGGSALGDFARMAAQGASFGFADEIVGAVQGPEAMAESRQRVDDLRQLSPAASTMSEIAGGVGVPFLTGARVARGLTRPGAGILGRAAAGAAGGAVGGGAGGALVGAGEAEGSAAQRLPSALRGGAIGAAAGGALGAALPIAGAGLAQTGRFGREVLQPERAGRSEARRRLRQVFEEAGIDADDVLRRMDELGPDAVIADLDPRLAREARNAVNQAASLERVDGPVDKLAQRTAERGERLARDMRKTAGISESMEAGQKAARRAVQEVREQHYLPLEEAFPQVPGENVQAALQRPRIREVARRTAKEVADGERPPSFTELQDIMMDLRDDVTAARAAGRPNASRRAAQAHDEIVSAMEADIPGFAEAQNAFRLASKRLEAYQDGFDAWAKSAREIRERMAELPPEAHDPFRAGLLQRWEEKLLTREGTAGSVNKILRAGPEAREQIRAAFGSDEAFRQFLRTRDLERTFRLTEKAVQSNSSSVQQGSDLIEAAPASKSEIFNKIYDALLSPGEARRMQAEAVGQRLLGNNAQEVAQTLRPNPFGFGRPGAGGGLGAAAGAGAAQTLPQPAPRPPAAPPTTVARDSIAGRIINPGGRNPLAELVSRLAAQRR